MTATETPVYLGELFPKASPELLRLFQAAQENAAYPLCSFHTIRDWLEIAGYDHESLHVLVLLLILAEEEGSLCIELSGANLQRRLAELVDAQDAQAWADRILTDLEDQGFPELIGASVDDDRPIIQYRSQDRKYLYFQRFLRHELQFVRTFQERLKGNGQAGQQGPRHEAVLREVLSERPLRQGGQPLQLDDEQRLALERCLTHNLVLICGGPGTGKTSIVLSVLRCLIRLGLTPEQIALAAPTGRAAQRLSDAIRVGLESLSPAPAPESPDALLKDIGAGTLHQLLGYVPSRDQFRRHIENPIPADVVIVDEVSMVGLVLVSQLFEALKEGARVILLGDKDQLPSIDAGAVLANLVTQGGQTSEIADSLVLLQTNHRSQPHIRETARAVNEQAVDVIDQLPVLQVPKQADQTWSDLAQEEGCRLLELVSQTPGEIRRIVQHWADYAYLSSPFALEAARCVVSPDGDDDPSQVARLRALFQLLENTRLLTLVREGPWGCTPINDFLNEYLRPRLDRHRRGRLFAGAPVLITRNDHPRQLYNGDVGLALRSRGGGLRVVFPRQGSFISYPAEALPAHELGFALTVHKSQGSEYGQVLLVLPPSGGRRLLSKELVYTGLTRAKQLAILCGTREVLKLAIGRQCIRESGLLRFE